MPTKYSAKTRPDGFCFCGRPSQVGIISCPSCQEGKRASNSRCKAEGFTKVWSLAQRCRSYGISVDEYETLLAQQGGVCAICKKAETLIRKGALCKLTIDHDHNTGRVRGILCNNCNRALGMLKDDPAILREAATYLEVA